MLPDGTAVEINTSSWTIPPVFEVMREIGNVPVDDYRRTFNLGVGMIVAVSNAKKALSLTPGAWQIGQVVASKRKRVIYK